MVAEDAVVGKSGVVGRNMSGATETLIAWRDHLRTIATGEDRQFVEDAFAALPNLDQDMPIDRNRLGQMWEETMPRSGRADDPMLQIQLDELEKRQLGELTRTDFEILTRLMNIDVEARRPE